MELKGFLFKNEPHKIGLVQQNCVAKIINTKLSLVNNFAPCNYLPATRTYSSYATNDNLHSYQAENFDVMNGYQKANGTTGTSFHLMNSLVGGFVGSKSQMWTAHGRNFCLWDIVQNFFQFTQKTQVNIPQKEKEVVSPEMNNISFVISNNNNDSVQSTVMKSYAEVTKLKMMESPVTSPNAARKCTTSANNFKIENNFRQNNNNSIPLEENSYYSFNNYNKNKRRYNNMCNRSINSRREQMFNKFHVPKKYNRTNYQNKEMGHKYNYKDLDGSIWTRSNNSTESCVNGKRSSITLEDVDVDDDFEKHQRLSETCELNSDCTDSVNSKKLSLCRSVSSNSESSDCSLPTGIRNRTLSDCSISSIDSDDSFIVSFEPGIDDEEDDNDNAFEFDFTCSPIKQNQDNEKELYSATYIDDANKKWNYFYKDAAERSMPNARKKVTFSNKKPSVKCLVAWDYALRSSRKGPWEQFARDRARFEQRVECSATLLDAILNDQHREKIFKQRFSVSQK